MRLSTLSPLAVEQSFGDAFFGRFRPNTRPLLRPLDLNLLFTRLIVSLAAHVDDTIVASQGDNTLRTALSWLYLSTLRIKEGRLDPRSLKLKRDVVLLLAVFCWLLLLI